MKHDFVSVITNKEKGRLLLELKLNVSQSEKQERTVSSVRKKELFFLASHLMQVS